MGHYITEPLPSGGQRIVYVGGGGGAKPEETGSYGAGATHKGHVLSNEESELLNRVLGGKGGAVHMGKSYVTFGGGGGGVDFPEVRCWKCGALMFKGNIVGEIKCRNCPAVYRQYALDEGLRLIRS